MLLNKHSLTIPSRFVGLNDARYMLSGVRVDDKEVVGTDGRVLCRLTHQVGHKTEEYPDCGQSKGDGSKFQSITIAAKEFSEIAKNLPKRSRLPILSHACLDTTEANKSQHVPIYTTDLENPRVTRLKKMEGDYLKVDQVMPKGQPKYRVYLDADLLAKIGKAFGDFKKKNSSLPIVCLEMTSGMAPVKLMAKNKDTGQELTMVLMPCKGEVYGEPSK